VVGSGTQGIIVITYSVSVAGYVGVGTTAPQTPLHIYTAGGATETQQNSSGTCTHTPSSSAETVSCSSDVRLKKDIVDTGDALTGFDSMRVRDFTIKATGERKTGVIAQEMLTNHSDMVHMGSDGFYKVDEPDPWKIIRAIQQLKDLFVTDRDELAKLKADNDNLAAQLKAANDNEAALTARLEKLESAKH